MGFWQDEIRILLSLSPGKLTCRGEVKLLAEKHFVAVSEKIVRLERAEQLPSSTIAQRTGGEVPKCPIIEAISAPVAKAP